MEINFSRTPVVLLIAALGVAIELTSLVRPEMRDVFYNTYRLGIWMPMWLGEYWRPLTTTLLHGNLLHLAMNMMALLLFAPLLEMRLGSLRMLALVVLLAYTSSLVQYVVGNYFTPVGQQAGLVGFSGVLFGLAGFLFVARHYHHELARVFGPETFRFLLMWFLFALVATQMGWLRVGNLAHGAGFVFGVLYGLAWCPTYYRPLWLAVAVVATVAVCATMIAAPGHPAYELVRQVR